MSRKVKRVNISMPDDWHEEFKRHAEQRGVSFSSWLTQHAVDHLPEDRRQTLSDRQRPGRPKNIAADKS